jgi:hypothetical protein
MVSACYSVLQSVLLFVACCIYFCIFPMTQLLLNFTCFAIKFMYLFLNSSNTFTKGYVCTMYILWCFCHLVLGLLTQQVNKLDWIELNWVELNRYYYKVYRALPQCIQANATTVQEIMEQSLPSILRIPYFQSVTI